MWFTPNGRTTLGLLFFCLYSYIPIVYFLLDTDHILPATALSKIFILTGVCYDMYHKMYHCLLLLSRLYVGFVSTIIPILSKNPTYGSITQNQQIFYSRGVQTPASDAACGEPQCDLQEDPCIPSL